MDVVIKASSKERESLFRNTSIKKGMNVAIIEKDFWVCYVIDYLFHYFKYKNDLVFKGGTSLSKVYKVINRFSEDVDLILDWRILGYEVSEPWKERSKNKQNEFNEEINERAAFFLREKFLPAIKEGFLNTSGVEADFYIGEADPQTILFAYPRSFADDSILQVIRLEIGPLAAWGPSEIHSIRPYVAEEYPNLFPNSNIKIPVVSAERTFWEKATILHREAYRRNTKMPSRYSRHYYDLYCMMNSKIKERAFNRLDLLKEVLLFKEKFYCCNWAEYDEAMKGNIRLVPSSSSLKELKADYEHMQNMIYGKTVAFSELMRGIEHLEKEIRGLDWQGE